MQNTIWKGGGLMAGLSLFKDTIDIFV